MTSASGSQRLPFPPESPPCTSQNSKDTRLRNWFPASDTPEGRLVRTGDSEEGPRPGGCLHLRPCDGFRLPTLHCRCRRVDHITTDTPVIGPRSSSYRVNGHRTDSGLGLGVSGGREGGTTTGRGVTPQSERDPNDTDPAETCDSGGVGVFPRKDPVDPDPPLPSVSSHPHSTGPLEGATAPHLQPSLRRV